MRRSLLTHTLAALAATFSLVILLNSQATAVEPQPSASLVPLDDLSPALLGIYRKVMAIEADIDTYAAKYGVSTALAKAVCMFESGGNANLASSAGAQGYFQVMPATFRLMRVGSNIEAGIKYLGSLVKQFGREDYALAAYNGGPGRVARGRAMPLESLQYVIGVGTYRSALATYEPSIRAYAGQLEVTTISEGDTWLSLSERLGLPIVQLRLHNPFLAARPLRPGATIVYPREPRQDLFDASERNLYRARVGDNYLKVAYALGVAPTVFRDANDLWRLQSILPGTTLTIPPDPDVTFTDYAVRGTETVSQVAMQVNVDPWWIIRDNYLWDEQLAGGTVLRIRRSAPPAAPARPAPVIRYHLVKRGDTLSAIARRYRTTVRAVQNANRLGRRTVVRIGQRLRIP